jgi:hypothetical protein
VDREPAPPGADLQQVVAGTQVEPLADPLELRPLGLVDARIGAREVRARVHQPLVEEGLEQPVAEVVVCGDVPARAAARVAADQPADPLHAAEHGVRAAPPAIEWRQAAGRDPDHGHEVVRLPQPFHVSLAEPGAAAKRPPIRARVADIDSSSERRVPRPEAFPAAPIDDLQAPAAHPAQQAVDGSARYASVLPHDVGIAHPTSGGAPSSPPP